MRHIKYYLKNPLKLLKPSLLLAFLALFAAPYFSMNEWESKKAEGNIKLPHATFSFPAKDGFSTKSLSLPYTTDPVPAMEYKTEGSQALVATLPAGATAWNGHLLVDRIAKSLSMEKDVTAWKTGGTEQLPKLFFSYEEDGRVKSCALIKAQDSLIQFTATGDDSLEVVTALAETVSLSAQHPHSASDTHQLPQ